MWGGESVSGARCLELNRIHGRIVVDHVALPVNVEAGVTGGGEAAEGREIEGAEMDNHLEYPDHSYSTIKKKK
jgi:hypothetical protein